MVEGDEANSLSDRLMLYTVLMSISLFLLGIAAVVRQYRVQLLLVISGSAIFAVSAILTAMVPFIGLSVRREVGSSQEMKPSRGAAP